MVPELVNKFTEKNSARKKSKAEEEAREAAAQDLAEKLNIPKDEKTEA